MCFAPQQRALFRHLNFQMCSDVGAFCTFWLGNVLRTTTACTFWTSQLPKVVWDVTLFTLLTWKCASRHNGVQFFISHLVRWLRTHHDLASLLFDPPEPQIIGQNTVRRDFSTFSRTCIFFLLTLPSLLWSCLFFSLLWLFQPLAFPSVHIVGSLTSKLPSIILRVQAGLEKLYMCGTLFCLWIWLNSQHFGHLWRVKKLTKTVKCTQLLLENWESNEINKHIIGQVRAPSNAEKDLINIKPTSNKETWRSMIEFQCAKSINQVQQHYHHVSRSSLQDLRAPNIEWPWMTMNSYEWPSVTINELYHALVTSSITAFHRYAGHAVLGIWFVLYQWLPFSWLLSNKWVWPTFVIRNTLDWIGRLAKIANGTQRLLGSLSKA